MASIIDDLKRNYKYGGAAQKLIFWNIGISVVFFILHGIFPVVYEKLFYWLVLTDDVKRMFIKPWTLLTYSFIHAGIVHLILNMILLYFVSQLFSTFFSQKQFMTTYILGAIVGGVFFELFGLVFVHSGNILVGASAAIISPLFALVTFNPHMQIRLLLIGNVKIWYIAAFIVAIDLLQLMGTSNIGGHLAHLGGAALGVIYALLLKEGKDISLILDKIANILKKKKGTPFKKVYVNKNNTANNTVKEETQKQIDLILDKISKSGYESLTKEEKSFLFNAGKE